jgi:hypothetical protein
VIVGYISPCVTFTNGHNRRVFVFTLAREKSAFYNIWLLGGGVAELIVLERGVSRNRDEALENIIKSCFLF